ncbi:uncharacterized protein LDX57_011894 [Aspergillus melleus]|uniref:uncharacterized protein n=1 Tax=Aspergillus melleus TaxID=138277 RepID=UPI001E8E4DF9|nr:uncharacterized protein LDX57_011894 [Aspergillus melleus]KAH8434256.1 hypothetical protein LDX57_011894 [Aspergillus melleus]
MQGKYEEYKRHLERLNGLSDTYLRLNYTHLPSLQTVTLFVSFECVPFQGNDPAELDRPGQSAWRLQLKGGGWLGSFRPYTLFHVFRGSVPVPNVRFDLAGIRHNPWNLCPNVGDQCWCRGKSIDADSVPWEKTSTSIIEVWKYLGERG